MANGKARGRLVAAITMASNEGTGAKGKGAGTRIGIIGQGNVGKALERGLSAAGHEVRTSSSDPDEVREVGEWGEALILAVPFKAREDAIGTLGDAVEGKVLVDVTNALGDGYSFAGDLSRSGAEELQGLAEGARVVKAFNTVFAAYMDKGTLHGETLTAFVAGDDEEAKGLVTGLAQALGFDAVDAGGLESARWLEALGYTNIALARQPHIGWESGFRYVHKGARPAAGKRPAPGQERERKATAG